MLEFFLFNFFFPGVLIVFKFSLLVKAQENEVVLLFNSLQYLNTFFCEMQRGILYLVFCLVLT